ncbi:hypothetical protein S2M10_29450 [Sphingomonas sp. S2M10]|uniref:hypothetical protein n=1 Tax=Sphingomonas sp. S2M10 TaxID=2705010 RepID=UPI0014571656|nr:hypothetical protein [Sphingomonas sp. S2M10]NLS27943.1 hypothetical protein [Sphingomonas sp. S2M10]
MTVRLDQIPAGMLGNARVLPPPSSDIASLAQAQWPCVEPKNRLTPIAEKAKRIRLLQSVGEMIGQAALAEALGIEPRSLRAKLGADRGITDAELALAAAALDAHARDMKILAARMRGLVDGD